MKAPFKILFVLLMLPLVAFANDNKFKGKYTKEKTLKKEYTVNANARLEVDNSYGNIDIVSWGENRVVIEVHIKTNGNNEEKVQRKLDDIDVNFSASASNVSAKTIFDGKKNSSWSWWGNSKNNVNMEINYTIKLPVTNNVDLSNDYGSININRLEGVAVINCDYGQLNIGELMADGNYFNFDYTKNSTIGFMKSGKINADYSGFTLEKVGKLDITADYSRSEVNEASSINYNCDYGKLYVGSVGDLVGRGDYIPLKIEKLTGGLDVVSDYGSVTVERITSEGGNVTIKSDYAGIKLGFDSGYNFDFDIDLSYAGLRGEDYVNVEHTSKNSSKKTYRGYHGSKGSGNRVNINSDYGSVTFRQY